jgi:DNA polymerase III delta prime subunit
MSPKKQVVGRGHVKRGLHDGYSEHREEHAEGITVVWDEAIDGPSRESIEADPELKESALVTSGNNYYLCSLTRTEFDRILELGERSFYSEHDNSLSVPESEITVAREGLYFTDNEWGRIQSRVEEALMNGNHVLLFGPPGTGKTKLARQVCEATVGADNYELVTASADWSTFDTVGGYQTTSQNTLEFEPGVILDRFQKDSDGTPANEWLVIDELNRADIDKAFGSLFSALTGESVTLPFDGSDGDPIQILDSSQGHAEVAPNRFYIPDDWRMLATMNTLDKTSLYEMSYAFMRRWAFVPVGIPELPDREDGDDSELEALVADYVAVWAANGDVPEAEHHYETVGRIWRAVNEERAIGPAIVEDIYEYVAAAPSTDAADYVSPIIMYVFPQLEGLRRNELERLIGRLDAIIDDETGELWTVARDFFQVELQPSSGE